MAVAAGIGGLAAAWTMWHLSALLTPHLAGRPTMELSRSQVWTAGLAVAAASVAGAAAVGAFLPVTPATGATMVFAAAAPGLAWIDIRTMTLPLAVSAVLAAGAGLAFGIEAAAGGESSRLAAAVWSGLGVGVLALAWWWTAGGQVGLGDVALLAVIAFYLGWWSWAASLIGVLVGSSIAVIAAGVFRLRLGRSGSYVPIGPYLLVGWWVALAMVMAGSV